ncbi:hypothetical protein NHF45_00065 [Maricaulaceae bacterium NA33B04]|nr:hypothetical protein [Maricaulaceae bacterium NA33B04]
MKYAISVLTLAIAGAGAALAASPQLTPPGPVSPSQPGYVANIQPRSNTCDIQLFEPRLVAMANPAQASSWSLTVETPSFYNQQSGPIGGTRNLMKPVTTIVMGGNSVSREEGVMVIGDPMLERPFDAELRVFDVNGELVCRDTVHLPDLNSQETRSFGRRF